MRYRPYPTYKDSGVDWLGKVPEHWEVKRVKTSVKCWVSNVDKMSSDDELPVRLCNYTNVYYSDRIHPNLGLMDATATTAEIRRFGIRVHDVLITKDSEEWTDIAVPSLVVETTPDLVCGYHLAIIRPQPESLIGPFLHRAFQSCAINQQFQIAATGVTRYGLPKSAIGEAWVPIPPLKEQRAIANFLDAKTATLDALLAKKQALIKKLKKKRTALISRTVTRGLPPEAARAAGLDPYPMLKPSNIEWLGDVPGHWKVTRLKHAAAKIVDCPHETPIYSPDGDYAVIRTADLTSGVMDFSSAYHLDEDEYRKRIRRECVIEGDIVYGREGERWGYAAQVPSSPTVCLGQRMMQFRAADQFNSRFLMWQLNASSVYNQGALDVAGATSPHVNVQTIRDFWLTEPPTPEQHAIAEYLDRKTAKIDRLTEKIQTAIEKLQEYRMALITAAVTGRIDVREAAP